MNCTHAKEKIDQLVFEKNKEQLKEVEQHISTCESCSNYFSESLPNQRLFETLKKAEPTLKNPEVLTNSILSKIENLEQESPVPNTAVKSGPPKLSPLFVRLLAAASVCLLLVLGVEQYKVVTKVRSLEATLNLTSGNSTYTAQSSGFMLPDASKLNSGLINFMLTRNNKGALQTAINYQSEQQSKKRDAPQQNTFLNSRLYKLIGN